MPRDRTPAGLHSPNTENASNNNHRGGRPQTACYVCSIHSQRLCPSRFTPNPKNLVHSKYTSRLLLEFCESASEVSLTASSRSQGGDTQGGPHLG